tara:strand:- start:3572 stop:4345 length:774 start_codon:yes stop_codon:yes gene_type:complete
MRSVNAEWYAALDDIIAHGASIKPRGLSCLELCGYQTVVDMEHPILTVPGRNIGYKFMAAEAAWILSGDNRTSTITPYSREIGGFSDDGITYHGAYGPKIRDQLHYVVDCLGKDPDTRQAVINIWRENPPVTKDVPCTLSLQWVIREDTIHCIDTMRSSDIWLGWPYDVFNMSMITRYILLYLRQVHSRTYKLGTLRLTAGSQHLYTINQSAVIKLLTETRVTDHVDWRLPLYDLSGPDALTKFLWECAEHGTLTSL